MTDGELMGLAAKAAGYLPQKYYESTGTLWVKTAKDCPGGRFAPLTDDGDALRLAVKLRLSVAACVASRTDIGWFTELNGDELAATRRAIVRAAAEIGGQSGREPPETLPTK